MRAYLAFTKKEFCEITRTYKLLIMGAVFLLFGFMNPLMAKLTPQILENYAPEGMNITIAEPTALDSWVQFYKNIPLMGLIVLVIVFSGLMANEFTRGTLTNMLTKGLSRSTVILAKFTMAVIVWTLSYVSCFLVSYAYTVYFWSDETVSNLLFSVFCLWLFGILLLATIMLGSVLCKSIYGCLLFTGGFVSILFLMNIIPNLQEYNPVSLSSNNMALLTKQMVCSEFYIPITVSVILAIVFLFCSIIIFNKKQI